MKKLKNCVLLLATLLALQTVALATDTPALSLTYPEDNPVGETFAVAVELSDNLGFSAVQMTLHYDDTVLQCTEAQTGDLMDGMLSATNPEASLGAIVVGASTSEITGDGTLATFTFEVLTDGAYQFYLYDVLLADIDGNHYTLDMDLGAQGATAPPTTTTDEQTEVPERTIFADTVGHWAVDAIDEMTELGLVNGYDEDYYGPDDTITRGQLVTILWRNAGSPEPAQGASFIDLNPNDTYYHDAVAWAEETGAVNGYGNGYFGPDDPVTREQLAAILYRMGGENLGMSQVFSGIYDTAFQDEETLNSALKEAVYWAIYNDIWCGTDGLAVGTTLAPKEPATRGQIAVMLCGYLAYQEGET